MTRFVQGCRPILLILLLLVVAGPSSASALARLFAPQAELWARWQAHRADAVQSIDHRAWEAFLRRYVVASADGINRVAYAAVTPEDRAALDAYIAALGRVAIDEYPRAEQLAYWLNLYNALTVQVVLEHWPVASIRDIDISPGLFADGPWGKVLIEIQGEGVTLNDIEHRILRPIWRDPRIHYVVNCASIGCPDLQPTAFTADNAESLMDTAARAYVNHPRGVSVGADGVVLSSIYNWFVDDFAADGGVLAHVRRYAGPALRERLGGASEIADYRYDWSVNAAEGLPVDR